MSWLKDFFIDIGELIKKLDARQAFIVLMCIVFLSGGYLFYHEYNKTQIIMAKVSKGQPTQVDEKSIGEIHEAGFIRDAKKKIKAVASK